MNTSLLLAFTFFASFDAGTTPTQKDIDAALMRCEASAPGTATVAIHDGKRIIVMQAPGMAVEVRAKRPKKLAAANLVATLATRVTGKAATERHA